MTIKVLKPEPQIYQATPGKLAPRLGSLQGKVIGVLRYNHMSKSIDEDAMVAFLRAREGLAGVIELFKETTAPFPQQRLEEAAQQCDAVIGSSCQ